MLHTRREREDRDDSGDAEDRTDIRRAHRDRCSPVTGFERHTQTVGGGRDQTCCGCDLDDRRRASTCARFEFERGTPSAAARGDDRDRDDERGDGDDAQCQDRPVEVHTGVGFGTASDTDREQRRRGDGPERGEDRAADRDHQSRVAVDRGALTAGESERVQRRLIDAREGDLPSQDDRDRDPACEGGDSGEDPQRGRQHVDRVLRAVVLNRDRAHAEEQRGGEDPPRRCHDPVDIGCPMAGPNPKDAAVAPDPVRVVPIEGRGLDEDAARRAAVPEVQRSAHNPNDP